MTTPKTAPPAVPRAPMRPYIDGDTLHAYERKAGARWYPYLYRYDDLAPEANYRERDYRLTVSGTTFEARQPYVCPSLLIPTEGLTIRTSLNGAEALGLVERIDT